jgi:hypothetical protein
MQALDRGGAHGVVNGGEMNRQDLHARFLEILAKAEKPRQHVVRHVYADPETAAKLVRDLRSLRIRGWKKKERA